jgi:hypothetical protein
MAVKDGSFFPLFGHHYSPLGMRVASPSGWRVVVGDVGHNKNSLLLPLAMFLSAQIGRKFVSAQAALKAGSSCDTNTNDVSGMM